MNCLKCNTDFSAMEQVPFFTDKGGNEVPTPTLSCPCGMNYTVRDSFYGRVGQYKPQDIEQLKNPKKLGRIDGIYGHYVYADRKSPAAEMVEKLLDEK